MFKYTQNLTSSQYLPAASLVQVSVKFVCMVLTPPVGPAFLFDPYSLFLAKGILFTRKSDQ